jgi:hypothetical protein
MVAVSEANQSSKAAMAPQGVASELGDLREPLLVVPKQNSTGGKDRIHRSWNRRTTLPSVFCCRARGRALKSGAWQPTSGKG